MSSAFPYTREKVLDMAIGLDSHAHLRDSFWRRQTSYIDAFKGKISTAIGGTSRDGYIIDELIADRADSDTTERTDMLKEVLSNSFDFLEGTVKTGYSVVGRHSFSFRYDRKDLHMTVTYKCDTKFPLYEYFHFVRRMLIRVDVITNIYPELTTAFLLNADEPIDEN